MAISFSCRRCAKPYNLDDSLAGKRARCKQCGLEFDIPRPAPARAAAIARSSSRSTSSRTSSGRPGAGDRPDSKIAFDCESCGKPYSLDRSYAGKLVRCTQCRHEFEVPATSQDDDGGLDPYGLKQDAPAALPPRGSASFAGHRPSVGDSPARPSPPPSHEVGDDFVLPRAAPLPKPGSSRTSRRRSSDSEVSVPSILGTFALVTVAVSALAFVALAVTAGPGAGLIGAMGAAGVCGLVLCFGCGIWAMIIPFQESVAQGLMYLFVPFYSLIYLVTRWDTMRRPFLVSLVGFPLYVGLVSTAVILPAIAGARKAAQAAADRQQARDAGAADIGAQPRVVRPPRWRGGEQVHPEAAAARVPAPEPEGPDIPRGPNGWGWINLSDARVEQPDGRGLAPGRPIYKVDYRVEGGRPLSGRLMVWVIEAPGYVAKFNQLRFEPSGTLSGSLTGPIAAGGPYQTYIAVEKFDINGPSLVKISPSIPIGDPGPASDAGRDAQPDPNPGRARTPFGPGRRRGSPFGPGGPSVPSGPRRPGGRPF